MKRLLIPIIILAVIIVVWLIQSGLEKKKTTVESIKNFLGLELADVDRMNIVKDNNTLTFYRENTVWFFQDTMPRKADPNVMDNVLNSSVEIEVENIVSQNPERQIDFQVDSVSGMLVEYFGGGDLLNAIIIGKTTNGYTHTYVRRPGSDDVYLATGPLGYTFNRPVTGWLDKTILSLLSGSIDTIAFKFPDKEYKLIRIDTVWEISKPPYTAGEATESIKVNSLVNQLVTLTASDFVNASDSGLIDFDHPSLTVKFSLLNGSTESIVFGAINENETRRYCRKIGVPETFVIKKSRFDNLLFDYNELLPQE